MADSTVIASSYLPVVKNNSWIDCATRAVFLEFTTYNPNMNQICYVWMRFEMPAGGGVVPFEDICCSDFIQYATRWDYWRLGHEILFVFCTLYLTVNEIWEIIVRLGGLK